MNPPPLIDHTERSSRLQQGLWRTCTALLWLFYAVLWVPLVTLVAWVIGIDTAWFRLYRQQGMADPFVLAALPIIALMCATLLIGWAEYNRLRAEHASAPPQRRPDVDATAVAASLGLASDLSLTLRRHRIVRVTMNEDAVPTAVRPQALPAAARHLRAV